MPTPEDLYHFMKAGGDPDHPERGILPTNGRARPPILSVEDDEVLTLCRGAKNAAKFASLFDDGDISGYDSASDADFALLGILKFYTQDADQLENLMRRSALRRAKWNKGRGGITWLRYTIGKALGEVGETYSPGGGYAELGVESAHSRSHSLGMSGMRNDLKQSIQAVSFRGREKPGPREWLVERAVCKGHAATWYGEGGIAKSLIAAHLGLSLASPSVDKWAGLKIRTVPVLYGDFELDETEHLRRSQELAAGMGLDDVPALFHYLPLVGLPAKEAFEVATEECKRLGAELFVVDSVGFALEGDSELAKDVLRFHREYVQPVRDVGATPLLIDHQSKLIKGEKYSDKQEFGSVYKTNSTRSSFQIRGSWDGSELTATFAHKKTNFGPKVDDFSLKVVFERGLIKVELLDDPVPNPDREPSKKEQVRDAIAEMGRATAETAARKTGLNLKTVQNAISELIKEEATKDTGEKDGRSRIVVPHSLHTQGTGTGTPKEPTFTEEF